MQELHDYLASIEAGPLVDTTQLERLLARWWDMFEGSDEGDMEGYKLLNRMEDVVWHPPILSFVMERHGAMAFGSSRAELHRWHLNVQKRAASCEPAGYRQIRSMQPRVDVRPIAEEIARLILTGREDHRLKWYTDGSVRVYIGKIFPESSAVQQTIAGRRKRFRQVVDELLRIAGWQTTVRPNVYMPPAANQPP